MSEEPKYQSFQDILKFLSFDYKFDTKDGYPFNRDPKNVIFAWGQLLIPRYGIREMVQNKISDIKECPINEIKMMYQIPFIVNNPKNPSDIGLGVVNQNISLGFRYDKQYKYGDITKSIYEVCWAIIEHSVETNDFYIIKDYVQEFFSYFIIPNQWGIGATISGSMCKEKYFGEVPNKNDRYPKIYKCPICEQWVEPVNGECPECGVKLDKEEDKRISQDTSDADTLKRAYKCEECGNLVEPVSGPLPNGACPVCGKIFL